MKVQGFLALALAAAIALLMVSFFSQILFFLEVTFISLLITLILTSIFIGFLKLILIPMMLTKRKKETEPKPGYFTLERVQKPNKKEE